MIVDLVYVAGVFFSGAKCAVAIVDKTHKILKQCYVATPDNESAWIADILKSWGVTSWRYNGDQFYVMHDSRRHMVGELIDKHGVSAAVRENKFISGMDVSEVRSLIDTGKLIVEYVPFGLAVQKIVATPQGGFSYPKRDHEMLSAGLLAFIEMLHDDWKASPKKYYK